ncbi:MAG TPA: GntR family transcriptional regulator [Burkholderiales bacterium]|nr:GntR family transcriptional regulator [Burkholderiales bacterium]
MGQLLYERIASALRDRITSGKLAVGDSLPTEAELCQRYGVSRYTAREALRRLRDAGLVTRRRRAGTTVASAAGPTSFSLPVSSAADLFRYATDTRFLIEARGMIRAGSAEVITLGCRRGQAWYRMAGIRRRASGAPVCLATVYLHATLAGLGRRIPRSAGVIYPRVEAALGVRIAWVRQRIEAVPLDAASARRLRSPAGGCALRVRRYYYDANERLLEVSDSLHPGERFAYEMRLQREGTASPP